MDQCTSQKYSDNALTIDTLHTLFQTVIDLQQDLATLSTNAGASTTNSDTPLDIPYSQFLNFLHFPTVYGSLLCTLRLLRTSCFFQNTLIRIINKSSPCTKPQIGCILLSHSSCLRQIPSNMRLSAMGKETRYIINSAIKNPKCKLDEARYSRIGSGWNKVRMHWSKNVWQGKSRGVDEMQYFDMDPSNQFMFRAGAWMVRWLRLSTVIFRLSPADWGNSGWMRLGRISTGVQ